MDEKHKQFKQFNWFTSKEWLQYYENLYPKPPSNRIEFWKKKFYKLKVDSEFDMNYESSSGNTIPNSTTQNNQYSNRGTSNNNTDPYSNSNNQGTTQNNKYLIDCSELCMFSIFLISILPKFSFTLYFALLGLLIKIFKKMGLPNLNMVFLQTLFNENYFQQFIYTFLLLIDKINLFTLFPIIITSVITVCIFIRRYLTNYNRLIFYANIVMNNRATLIRMSSRLELATGFLLIIGYFIGINSFLLPILYWQYIRFKYILNQELKDSFSELNQYIEYIKQIPSCPEVCKFLLSKLQLLGKYLSGQ